MMSSIIASWYDLVPRWPKNKKPRNWLERRIKREADEAEKLRKFEKLFGIQK